MDGSISVCAMTVCLSCIMSLLMSPLLGHRLSLWNTQGEQTNPVRGPSGDRWVLTTSNETGVNSLRCLPIDGGGRSLQTVLSFRDRSPSALTTWPTSSAIVIVWETIKSFKIIIETYRVKTFKFHTKRWNNFELLEPKTFARTTGLTVSNN
jgi:hypothetical protein